MTAQEILKVAVSQIGIKESPAGSNNVKYNTEYYGTAVRGSAYPWCVCFCWWIFKAAGASNLFYGGKKTAYCPTVESYYKSIGQWYSTPKVGDLVLFDFTGKGIAGHIGIVERVNADGTITTIEGNTSISSNDNGGAVMRRTRKMNVIRGFARPLYNSTTESGSAPTEHKTSAIGGKTVTVTLIMLRNGSTGANVKALQILLNGRGYNCGTVDGAFGANTQGAVKRFQSARGLEVDGIVGAQTWAALLA